MPEFKPNIYPILYWALTFGVVAGIALYLITLLAQFITIVWVPVFLVGMAWGAYRNYQTQKTAWSRNNGVPIAPQSAMNEFKQAFRDIRESSQELFNQEPDTIQTQEELPVDQEYVPADEAGATDIVDESVPPNDTNFTPPPQQQPPQPPAI